MEASTTRRPNRHHLPPIPGASPRGPAPSGRISPPFPRRPSECDRQRSTQAPTRQQTVHPARPPPPSQGRWPVCYRGYRTPRTRGQRGPAANQRPEHGVGGGTPQSPPPASRVGRHRHRTRAPVNRPTGPMRHGAPHSGCDAARPPGRRGRTTTTGARSRRPGCGRRNDRGLRHSEVRWPPAHRRVLSDVPATGNLHGEST